jgi:hypothetical protein
MKKMLTSMRPGSGSAISILVVTLLSVVPSTLQASGSPLSENLTEMEPEDPRLLETANVSDTSENLTEMEPEDPRLLETP